MQWSRKADGQPVLVSRTPLRALLLIGVLTLALLAFAAPALGYSGWRHSTATSKSSCAGGCHAQTTPTNATCTGCHATYKARGTQKCWDCHKPGQVTSSWQLLAGCAATCHISTRTSGQPSYTTAYTHDAGVHLGAAGYGRTCLSCHGVSTGAAAPGTSPHHDAADGAAPTCAGCHNGAVAAAPTGHEDRSTVCGSCHSGMDLPSRDCASCHVGDAGTTAPQISYTNSPACGDAACHGRVTNHAGTPISAVSCATCHTAHYQTLGACTTCHPGPQTYHHGTAAARPLADCAGCHDGGIATGKASHATLACSVCHADMGPASVPAACSQCHAAPKFGSATCTACHSPTGLTGREQVHNATPGAGVTCSGCHAGHNADLGVCSSCHGLVPEAHHGVAAVSSSMLSLSAGSGSVTVGAPVVVAGRLLDAGGAAVPGGTVLLQERRLSQASFSDLAVLATGADGGFSHTAQAVAGTRYRAVYRGGSPDAGGASVQRPAIVETTLTVVQSVTLSVRPGTTRAGAKVRLAGAVAPTAQQSGAQRPAVTLRADRRSGSRWVKAAVVVVRPSDDGSYSSTWRPKKAGSYRLRATVAACSDLLGGTSRTVRLRVR